MTNLFFQKQSEQPQNYEVSTPFGEVLGWVKHGIRGWYFLPKKSDLHYDSNTLLEIYDFIKNAEENYN